MFNPLVTVIIPCYNYGIFLEDAFTSVLNQTYVNWECIIVDDGSIDNTREVSENLIINEPRLKYFYKTNGGLSSARNFGIKHAQGDYICFLDTDDLFDKDKISSQINCFSENETIDIVYGNAMFFEKNNLSIFYYNKFKSQKKELYAISGKGYSLLKILTQNNITVVSSPIIKKDVFEKVGYFSEDYNSYEDWHFWIRCAIANCYFQYSEVPATCTYIRFGHESMMSNKKKMILAGIKLRVFLNNVLPYKLKPYNLYRLIKLKLKILFV